MRDKDLVILENRYQEVFESHTIGQMGWEDAVSMMRQVKKDHPNFSDEAMSYFVELEDRVLSEFASAFLGNKKLPWRKIAALDLIRVWKNFAKNQYSVHDRDVNILDKIKTQALHNIVALHVGNALSGHSQLNPQEMLEAQGYDFDDEQMERFSEYLELDGNWIVSDYGLPYLYPLFNVLYNAKTPDQELYAIDKILNVVHQRNDLANYFVEGGISTLLKVSE